MSDNKLFVMERESGRLTVKADALPWTSEGLPEGWSMQVFRARGMETFVFRVAPGASWPAHNGPDEWTGLILEGRMVLELSEPDGTQAEPMVCFEGDAFSICANLHHAWRNDGTVPARMAFTRKI
jgi:quercetin dioxygenase-like cupin family protein